MTAHAALDKLTAVDSLLSEEERDLASMVRSFADDKLRPHLPQWYEAGEIPAREIAKELGALGVLGMHLDGYDCAGASATMYGLACQELEAADSGLRSLMSVQGSLAMTAIHRFGSEEQKQQWLPPMAAGSALGCFGLTEPDFGSDPGGMRTRAKRDGDDWVINGSKMWITNGTVADVAVVWAQTEEKIRGFVVPTDSKGFTATEVGHKLSLRASMTAGLSFEDLRLPGDAVLPEVSGLRGPLTCLSEARFGIIFGAMGAARDCLETALEYADSRIISGKPLSGYQLTQAKLADMTLELMKGQLLALHIGRMKDAGTLQPAQVSVGKLNSCREAIKIARECRTILAANGITTDYPVLRHANNLESVMTYEGTSEVHQLIIGQSLTGQAAFR
ncbi:acyl-CoA dehydrogenase family protein [Dermatophilaceae bacterium Sec6.4]